LRILLLADINSIHTQKWTIALKSRGIEVGVFSLNNLNHTHPELQDFQLFHPGLSKDLSSVGLLQKLKYLTVLPSLKKCIKNFAPDIVHAHYASSYGLLGSLCGFHPYLLSVWGSDIFDFPNSSYLARLLIRYNLKKADRILSTSLVMAEEAKKYTGKEIEITPFGVDLNLFKRFQVKQAHASDSIVIGTIKSLEVKYGIEYLIGIFAKLSLKYPELPMFLHIVGGGSLEGQLKEQTRALGIENQVVFLGMVPHEKVPSYLNNFDIYSALSISDSESFGVAVIEASACELPVVVTNIGGLKEVVEDGVTGLLVPPKDIEKSMESFETLLFSKGLRTEMGRKGRERVNKIYNWNENVARMIAIYQEFFSSKG